MSNWESRPLRFSQEHYAAMDAWILVQMMDKMLEKAKKQKIQLNQMVENIAGGERKKTEGEKNENKKKEKSEKTEKKD